MTEENRNLDVLCNIMPRESLIATKLLVPPRQVHLVPRPRLTDLLNSGLGRRLVLLSAPAGYGKTTLLSEWVQAHEQGTRGVAWVSCDDDDNDPARFWSYVVGALEIAEPTVGKCVRTLKDSFP